MSRSHHLEELLQGCLNGTLDETQERELARLLEESSVARQALRSYLKIEGGLLSLAKAGNLSGNAPVPTEQTPLTFGTDHELPVTGRMFPRPPVRWRWVIGLAGVAASVLLLVLGIHWLTIPSVLPPAPTVLAHVVEMEGCVEVVSPSGAVRPAALHEPLRAGDSLRTGDGNSVTVIELADGIRLELSPETTIRLPDDGTRNVQLIQGVVRGNEAAHAEGRALVVTTSALQVRVEGDRFSLSASSAEGLRVEMEVGKAEVVRQRDQKSLTVESGTAVFVHADVEDMIVETMPQFVTEPRRVLDFPGAWAVFFDPEGKDLLAASYREIQRFGADAKPHKTLLSTDTSHGRFAAFSRDGHTLVVYRGLKKDDPVIFWGVRTQEQLLKIDARITDRRFALAPDASWLATIDKEESPPVVHLWDGKTGSRRFSLSAEMRIECLAAAPAGDLLAVGLVDLGRRERNKILLVDAVSGKEVAMLPTRAFPLTALTFSRDGRYLAAGITGLVQIWDLEKRELVRTIRGFDRVLMTLTFSPDGNLLAGGTQDGQVWLWDANQGDAVQIIRAGTSGVRLLEFSADGRALATGGIKRHPLMIWDAPSPQGQRPEGRRE